MNDEVCTLSVHSKKVRKGDFVIIGEDVYKITKAKKNAEGGKTIEFVELTHSVPLSVIYQVLLSNGQDLVIVRLKDKK